MRKNSDLQICLLNTLKYNKTVNTKTFKRSENYGKAYL